jgi:hypothetical protein
MLLSFGFKPHLSVGVINVFQEQSSPQIRFINCTNNANIKLNFFRFGLLTVAIAFSFRVKYIFVGANLCVCPFFLYLTRTKKAISLAGILV